MAGYDLRDLFKLYLYGYLYQLAASGVWRRNAGATDVDMAASPSLSGP